MSRLNGSQRGLMGYQYSPQVVSNIQTKPAERTLLDYSSVWVNPDSVSGSLTPTNIAGSGMGGAGLSLSGGGMGGAGLSLSGGKCGEYCKCRQCGQGVLDAIKNAYKKGKRVASTIVGNYTSEKSQRLRNMLPNADETAAPGFAGELHAVLKLPNGLYGTANFMGPGTQVVKRVKRGDRPRTVADKVAEAHDIRYSLTDSQSDVQRADKMMIDRLQEALKKREDNTTNINLGLRPIQAKYMAEKHGLISPGTFAKFGIEKDPADRALLSGKLAELEQEGYGMLPGENLKKQLLKTYNNMGEDKKDMLKGISSMLVKHALPIMIKRLGGNGLKLAGQGKNISQALYMAMLKKQDDGASRKLGAVLGADGMRGRGIVDTLKKVKPYAITAGKILLPIVMGAVEKKIREKYLSGSGIARAKKIINKHVANAMTHYIKNDGNIKNMYGTGFWQDFGKGFVKGFTTTMKIGLPLVKMLI